MIPGYKPFLLSTPATPATLLPLTRVKAVNGSNGSDGSKVPQNNYDTEIILERAAIMQYDGELPRHQANTMAAADYDSRRPKAAGDTRQVVAEYQCYLQHWQPSGEDDLPQPPPNTRNNASLWELFWQKIEEAIHYEA